MHLLHRKTTSLLISYSLLSGGSVYALDTDGAMASKNDRFANDPSFIMNGYDLSGVGRSSNGTWATLISENVFVSAKHFHPGNGNTITFFSTNNPGGAAVTRTVDGMNSAAIAGTDIWLGVLNDPVPVGYAIYDFATEDIDNASFTTSIYYEQNAFVIGRSPNSYSNAKDVAVGRNILDDWADNNTYGDSVISLVQADNTEDNYVAFETALVGGDSGAPLFVDFDEGGEDSALRLVGTNWYIDTEAGVTTLNGYTYLGNYDGQIQEFIDLHALPEPSSLTVIGVVAILLTARRRRAI